MKPELKDCPFCGSPKRTPSLIGGVVSCPDCGVRADGGSSTNAVAMWNRRATLPDAGGAQTFDEWCKEWAKSNSKKQDMDANPTLTEAFQGGLQAAQRAAPLPEALTAVVKEPVLDFCPLNIQTATYIFDPTGYDANDCAGCGLPLERHIKMTAKDRVIETAKDVYRFCTINKGVIYYNEFVSAMAVLIETESAARAPTPERGEGKAE